MTSYVCPVCQHSVPNSTVHVCPPIRMSETRAMELVLDAADNWRRELIDYIAPASEEFRDPESAKNQRTQADQIAEAITTLRAGAHQCRN